jgi:2-C-methyl-D-erythritol 2,4-cyclodiphosphate synthase
VKFRIGIGFDLHRLGPGTELKLGGISIPHEKSLIGHSDGDVLIHAVTDALLGACGLGNIGVIFPDSDPRFRGISSVHFLKRTAELLRTKNYEIGNVDSNILAERPKLLPYFPQMQLKIAEALEIPADRVSVKAKTMERIGVIGTEEAIAAEAVALVFIDGI